MTFHQIIKPNVGSEIFLNLKLNKLIIHRNISGLFGLTI